MADGDRSVDEVYDWVGGELPKPETGYLGAAGLVQDIAQATDRRGRLGLSAFELAVLNGYPGTEAAWLASLIGASAYEIWLAQGNVGTEAAWLESLVGRTNYQLAVANGFPGTEAAWLASLIGASAYEIWLAQGNVGTEAAFLEYLEGRSAYEVWLSQPGNAAKTEADFFAFLKGEQGDSAYEVWLSQPGNAEKTEVDFFAFLKGEQGAPAPILTSRYAHVSPYSYCGVATVGTSESAAAWKITRIEISNDGAVTATLAANNVAWTNRFTVTYA